MTRLLGIDLGERRIGLAVADTGSGAVRPLSTISRADPKRDAATLTRVTREQQIDELVIGLPLNMDGTEGAQARFTREWAASVAPALNLPVGWRDERLSSERAEAAMERAPRGRAGGPPSPSARNARRQRIDREAAAGILQAELDARSSEAATTER